MKILTICNNALVSHSLTRSVTVFNFTVTTPPPSEYSSSQYARPNGNFLLLSVVAAQFSLSLARAEPIKENLCGLFLSRHDAEPQGFVMSIWSSFLMSSWTFSSSCVVVGFL
jgi:hypothetical protein